MFQCFRVGVGQLLSSTAADYAENLGLTPWKMFGADVGSAPARPNSPSNSSLRPLRKEKTKLSASDYRFLERFLDVTKANLFLARAVLIVEGDAENILLPVILEKLRISTAEQGGRN